MSFWVPVPVAAPLAVAALLLIAEHVLPHRVPDIIALMATLFAGVVCVILAHKAAQAPLVYWFGNWTPRDGLVLGIGFVVGQAGAIVAALVALLFSAAFVFSWGYFDRTHAHFHALMLLFMAAMVAFCLTHDLFNLFVWFEVMSVAAFALTGYALEAPALTGALHFTVTNSIASFLMLGGIGLIYAEAGQLDFTAIARVVAERHADAVVPAAFALLTVALLIKAAIFPFQFWLADAHAVAPSPVSVIFSGAMVALGIFGVARLYWAAFAAAPAIGTVMHTLVLWLGLATVVIGGLTCLGQRHIKRLLAFSTISHLGVMLVGLAALSEPGTAGTFVYLVGHGLVKASLFMGAGIMLAFAGGIDEIDLRGCGQNFWPAGIPFALGGLLLAGLPVGLMSEGTDLIGEGLHAGPDWVRAAFIAGSGLTGGAVLRAAGRVYLGWGELPGEEQSGATEPEQETSERPLWLMLLPVAVLLAFELTTAVWAEPIARQAAQFFTHQDPAVNAGLGLFPARPQAAHGPAHLLVPWLGVGLALLVSGYDLGRAHLPDVLRRGIGASTDPVFLALDRLHSGLVGDYVVWIMVGLAFFAGAFALA
jgi:multicomponent Na+:H+ antiporter subunit D